MALTPHRDFVVPLPGGKSLRLSRGPTVMGILNITPDSFSDGGEHDVPASAAAHAQLMLAEGADLIDIGGESTRPGAEPVSAQLELERVIPVLTALRHAAFPLPLSIDTYKAAVAEEAALAGATIVNDVYGLQREPEIADVAALHEMPVIAMHWDPERDTAKDIIGELKRYFERSIGIAGKAGIGPDQLILDPGFGFAKSLAENYEILRRLAELHDLGCALLVGMSRKSMIGKLLDAPPDQRLAGTIATSAVAYAAGAHIFRVHDVRPNRDALRVAEAAIYGI
ncbi:MAG TPA: dihydropteroate synthase [Devosiaceae bacterium]|nr:dihydropteroate synthase [Devosiaceae bacterium]